MEVKREELTIAKPSKSEPRGMLYPESILSDMANADAVTVRRRAVQTYLSTIPCPLLPEGLGIYPAKHVIQQLM